jgi:3-oxoacyl-[acyl-carrier protein] reductase
MGEFSEKIVLVTGASQGIGLAIAQAFKSQGAIVHITGTRDGPGDYEWPLDGLLYHRVAIDSAEDRAALHKAVGALDVLVNNAGGGAPNEYELEAFAFVLQKNLVAVMDLCNRFKPSLAERKGSIVNIGSVAAFIAMKDSPAYSAAKAGMLGLTKALADKWAREGVRVNMVAPGFVRTRSTNRMRVDEGLEKRLISAVPMKRWADPEEISGPALFLASSAASYVTGTSLVADGGLLIR